MNQAHRDWLRKNQKVLYANIAPKEVADFLLQQDCLSTDDVERINAAVTTQDKVRSLLDILAQKSRHGLTALSEALKETSPWVLELVDPIPPINAPSGAAPITAVNAKLFLRLTKEADILNNWKLIARYLGMKEIDITVISKDYSDGSREQAHQMFIKWKSSFGKKATPEALISALRECELNAVADELEGI